MIIKLLSSVKYSSVLTDLNCFKKDESDDDEALELTFAEVSNESQISVRNVKVGEFSVGGEIVPRTEISELRKKESLIILFSAQKLCFGLFVDCDFF